MMVKTGSWLPIIYI